MKIIIVNGVARAGKDTFVDYIIEYANDIGHSLTKISTVDEIKRISRQSFGVGSEKTNSERRLWSDLKDAWTRYNDGPFNEIVNLVKNSKNNGLFVFVREPEEIAKFKDLFGDDCITVIIERSDIAVPNNHADQNVRNYEYMYHIENNGTLGNLLESAEIMYDEIFTKTI